MSEEGGLEIKELDTEVNVTDFLPAYPFIEGEDELFPMPFETAISSLKEFRQLSDEFENSVELTRGSVKVKPHQAIIARYASHRTPYDRLLVFHAMGVGKCLARDTPVMMYSHEIKPVQDIKPGDLLMGDDGQSRTVLSVCTGREEMFKVSQFPGGDSYTVNRSHILSLINSQGKKVDIDLVDYILLPDIEKSDLYGYQTGIYPEDFDTSHIVKEIKSLDQVRYLHGYRITNYKPDTQSKIRSLGWECYHLDDLGLFYSPNPPRNIISVKPVGVGEYYGFVISGNRRFLLGDTTVTHNTISAINAIEETISDPTSPIRKAVIFVKAESAEPNFYNTILRVTGSKYYPTDLSDEDVKHIFSAEGQKRGPHGEQSEYAKFWRQVRKNIHRFYTFHHFREFANKIDPSIPVEEKSKKSKKPQILKPKVPRVAMSDILIDEEYSNAFIVVDEGHHLHVEGDDELGSRTYNAFHKVFHKVKNSIIMIMSGTPMTNRAGEIAELMNLLLPQDRQMPTHDNFDRQFIPNGTVNSAALRPYFKGMVTCLRSIPSSAETVFVGNSKVTSTGLHPIDTAAPGYIVQRLVMSEFQSEGYLKIAGQGRFKMDPKSGSNFIFPDGSSDTKNFGKFMKITQDQESKRLSRAVGGKGRGYSDLSKPIPALTNEMKKALEGSTPQEILTKLSKFSIKFAYSIQTLLGGGCTYIYNNRVTGGGCLMLARILEMFGYVRTNGYLNLETADQRPRYAIMTNKSMDEKGAMSAQLQSTFNDPRNAEGKYIQVIIGSDISAEGVSFFHCEHIIIQTPHFHYFKIDQAVARGLRLGSHDVVSEIYRRRGQQFQVKIHLLCAIPVRNGMELDNDSVDVYFYKKSIDKDIAIKHVERAMREASFDCLLHRKINTRGTPFSRDCDFLDCNYDCNAPAYVGPPKLRNYNMYYAELEKDAVKKDVMYQFRKGFKFNLNDIQTLTRSQRFILLTALKEMIDDNVAITNRYGFSSYVREHDDIYFIIDALDQVATDDHMSYYTMYPALRLEDKIDKLIDNTLYNFYDDTLREIQRVGLQEYHLMDEKYPKLLGILPHDIKSQLIEGALIRANALGGRTVGDDIIHISQWILNRYKHLYYEFPNGNPRYIVRTDDRYTRCYDLQSNDWVDCQDNPQVAALIYSKHQQEYTELKESSRFFGTYNPGLDKLWIVPSEDVKATEGGPGNKRITGAVCGTGANNLGAVHYVAWVLDMDYPELMNLRQPRQAMINSIRKIRTIESNVYAQQDGFSLDQLSDDDLARMYRISIGSSGKRAPDGSSITQTKQLCGDLRKHMESLGLLKITAASESRSTGRT
jgi:hypothetical protein